MEAKALAAAVLAKLRPKTVESDELPDPELSADSLTDELPLDIPAGAPIDEREKLKHMIKGIFERLS
jgi:hypothetical protein